MPSGTVRTECCRRSSEGPALPSQCPSQQKGFIRQAKYGKGKRIVRITVRPVIVADWRYTVNIGWNNIGGRRRRQRRGIARRGKPALGICIHDAGAEGGLSAEDHAGAFGDGSENSLDFWVYPQKGKQKRIKRLFADYHTAG